MKKHLISATFIILLVFSCRTKDYIIMNQVAKELGASGNFSLYRVHVDVSQTIEYKKYFELTLNAPNLYDVFKLSSLPKVAAYRLYCNLSDEDRKVYEAIRIVVGSDGVIDTSAFFTMQYLESIHNSEIVARNYMKALENNDSLLIIRQFNLDKFGYTIKSLDSINNGFTKAIKNSYNQSYVFNWEVIDGSDSKYKSLIFITDTSDNHYVKFQFDMYDSIRQDKNIVSIEY